MSPLRGRRLRPVRSGNNSTTAEKTAENLSRAARSAVSRLSAGVIAFLLLLILAIGLILWYKSSYSSPEKVFWNTMANNLSTKGITKEIGQSSNGSNAQIAQISFVPEPRMKLVQKQSFSTNTGTTNVILESVVTPFDTYQHYLSIDRAAARGHKKLDYSGIYPLWVNNHLNNQDNSLSSTFSNVLFSTGVLSGNLTPEQRQAIVDKLHSAYKVDFKNVEMKDTSGRRVYIYRVEINLKQYAEADSLYAKSIGLPNAAHLSPNNFRAGDKISTTFVIDVMAHEVHRITYKSNSQEEKYSGYGISDQINLPKQTVTYQQLQKAVNDVK